MPFYDNLRTGLSNMRQNVVQTLADAKGTKVKAYDKKLKGLNDANNALRQKAYTRASRYLPGMFSEKVRNDNVYHDPKIQRNNNIMAGLQVERKNAARDRNIARMKIGLPLAVAGAAAGGAAYLGYRNRKKQEEENNYGYGSFEKGASFKEKMVAGAKALKDKTKAQAKATADNFKHAPELDEFYKKSRGQRAKDVLTFKRVGAANRILKDTKGIVKGKGIKIPENPRGNKALGRLRNEIIAFKETNEGLKGALNDKKVFDAAYFERAKKVLQNKGYKGKDVERVKNNIDARVKGYGDSASELHSAITAKRNNIKKTRDNEFVKAVAPYAAVAAVTAGGAYLYKKHKDKKKAQKETEEKKAGANNFNEMLKEALAREFVAKQGAKLNQKGKDIFNAPIKAKLIQGSDGSYSAKATRGAKAKVGVGELLSNFGKTIEKHPVGTITTAAAIPASVFVTKKIKDRKKKAQKEAEGKSA